MTTINYTDPALITDVRMTDTPRNPYVYGYGRKVPTCWTIRYANRMRRVYVMQYGNAGTAYIRVRGRDLVLDTATEHRLIYKQG